MPLQHPEPVAAEQKVSIEDAGRLYFQLLAPVEIIPKDAAQPALFL